jgi:site-specific DNA recombinase
MPFNAVQAQLAARTVQRKLTRSRSPSFLVGLIFDDRGNPMSPSHAKKKGVRYRYYVSHALLQNRKSEVGSVPRVSAPDVELLVCRYVRSTPSADGSMTDRDLIARYVGRIMICADKINVALRAAEAGNHETTDDSARIAVSIDIPFTPTLTCRKGVVHAPSENACIDPRERDVLLQTIVRARSWMDAVMTGAVASLEEIASAEGLGERHIRRLVPLAFLSPKLLQAILDGAAPSGWTVSRLTLALPHSWSAQEQMLAPH